MAFGGYDVPLRQEPPAPEEPLLADLARRLWLRAPVLLLLFMVLVAPLLWVITVLPDAYTARSTVMIDPRDRSGGTVSDLVPALLGDEPAVASEMEVLRSRDLVREVVAALDLSAAENFAAMAAEDDPTAAVVDAVQNKLTVSRLNESRVIEVAYESSDPVLAAAIVNDLTTRYLSMHTRQATAVLDRTSAWLDDRLETLQAGMRDVAQEAEAYRARSLKVLGTSPDLLERRLEDLVSRQAEASSAFEESQSRLRAFETALKEGDPRTALSLFDDPRLSQLLSDVLDTEQEIRAIEIQYGAGHALLREPEQRLRAATAQIEAEAAARHDQMRLQVDLGERTLSALGASAQSLQGDLSRARQREIEQRRLDREVAAAQDVLEDFLRQRREIESIPPSYTSAWLVSAADVPTDPSGPIRPVLALGAASFSGIAAAGLVLLPGALRLGRRRRLTALIRYPGVRWLRSCAGAPRALRRNPVPERAALQLERCPGSAFARSVRGITADILGDTTNRETTKVKWLTWLDRPGDCPALCSAIATSAAAGGRRVLLITARKIAGQEGPGLIALMSGKGQWDDCLIAPPRGGLPSVLPVEAPASSPADPAAFERALTQAQERFDLVLMAINADGLRDHGLTMPRGTSLIPMLPYRTATNADLEALSRSASGLDEHLGGVILTRAGSDRL